MAISNFISHNEYALLDVTQNLINVYAVYEFQPLGDSKTIFYFLFSPFLRVSYLFVHLELIDGTPTLKINHGSGTVVLQLPGNINVADRRWHRLDVRSNSKVGCFTPFTPIYVFIMSCTMSHVKLPSYCMEHMLVSKNICFCVITQLL